MLRCFNADVIWEMTTHLPFLFPEDSMDFYTVDPDYMEYLQDFETEKRGFSRVPNIRYKDRNKFTFGAVLDIGDFHYYVTLSSFNKS